MTYIIITFFSIIFISIFLDTAPPYMEEMKKNLEDLNQINVDLLKKASGTSSVVEDYKRQLDKSRLTNMELLDDLERVINRLLINTHAEGQGLDYLVKFKKDDSILDSLICNKGIGHDG